MADIKFRTLIVTFILFGLFVVAFLNGLVILGARNNPNQTILQDEQLQDYLGALNSSLSEFEDTTNSSESSFANSPLNFLSDNIIVEAISGIWKGLKLGAVSVFNITSVFVQQKLLSQEFALVFSVLAGIAILTVIISVWRMIHTGDGG